MKSADDKGKAIEQQADEHENPFSLTCREKKLQFARKCVYSYNRRLFIFSVRPTHLSGRRRPELDNLW